MISLVLALTLTAFSSQDSQLIKAVHEGTTQEVSKLAQNKKELNWKDSAGQDALFYAVSLNDLEKTKALVKAGASLENAYGEKKESLLFEATRLGSVEMLDFLTRQNKKILRMKNSDQESPLFTAVREDQSQAADFLMKKGLSAQDKNNEGKTPRDIVDPKNKRMVELFKKWKLTK